MKTHYQVSIESFKAILFLQSSIWSFPFSNLNPSQQVVVDIEDQIEIDNMVGRPKLRVIR